MACCGSAGCATDEAVKALPDVLLAKLTDLQRRFALEGGGGILTTAFGPWLVSAQPILRSDGSGRPRAC